MFYFFEVDDENIMEKIYRFRYEILCEELEFFPKNSKRIEFDKYDPYAKHLVAMNDNCEIVATARLIHHSPIGYPTQEHLEINPDVKNLLMTYKREKLGEVSRILLHKNYRNMHDTKYILEHFVKEKIYFMAKEMGMEYAFTAMEKSFIRLMKMVKVHLQIIGPKQNGYGSPRYPCLISTSLIERENPMLLQRYKKRHK
ncbi:hypothetical protein NitYY0826_C0898 [Nitratiruptor sp. YY08-26]|uniref:GNAT family N-acyltransferase n=1 Tax=unclassified Nitratiruptor TaxID=2624044 RepID=UPI0019168CEA|nr:MULTISPECIES: GNAT family N-acyltransferase [unclassified Nitratiruptor]BCD62030.1 hypothetical protein NitYY0813_C0896 [Nitratiruptor sp. YY08-13]BCD65966.1 hypothetical protein NitYY0826_C0898 [Nitratiruptor sp. YY08-26]